MASILSYKANCTMELIAVNGEEIEIPYLYITSVSTDYRFDVNIMPILYAILDVSPEIYKKIIDNSTDGIIHVRITNFDGNGSAKLEKEIINDQFIYFIPVKYNYEKELEGDLGELSMDTKHIVLGLIKSTMINDNKQAFNGVYVETTTKKMLEEVFLKGLPEITMDELEIETEYESLLIPPQETRAKAINYLFELDPFYTSPYIYFMDFDKTYLLNSVNIAANAHKKTVLFQIEQIDETSAYYTGISVEGDTAIVYVNQGNVNISINTTTDKIYNQIVSTNTNEVTTVDSNITMYKKDNTNRQRYEVANEMNTDIRKQVVDNTAVTLNISKMNMDSSLITPDKIFMVKYDAYASYNGRYILLYKKEIIVQRGEAYDTTTTIGIQRIADQEEGSAGYTTQHVKKGKS